MVAADAPIGAGVALIALSHVEAATALSDGALINTSASVDHNYMLDPFSSFAPGVVTGGSVHLWTRSGLCLRARVAQRCSIRSVTMVHAGSLALNDLPADVLAYGSLVQVIRDRDAHEPDL